jgi:DivIVA domain-containing protein
LALDRQTIEKKDFPIGRRGYEAAAVDEHLASVAREVEALRAETSPRTETLAGQASDRIRSIVEAAEATAAEIERQAEDQARETRASAEAEVADERETATRDAREYVARVAEATTALQARVSEMEGELGSLLESVRTGANRLSSDLQLLDGQMAEIRDGGVPHPAAAAPVEEPEAEPLEEPEAEPLDEEELIVEEEATVIVVEEDEPIAEEPVVEELVVQEPVAEEAAPDGNGDRAEDAEGARLVALNMALNGTPREETDQYLAEHFALDNRTTLLDEVYATVGE